MKCVIFLEISPNLSHEEPYNIVLLYHAIKIQQIRMQKSCCILNGIRSNPIHVMGSLQSKRDFFVRALTSKKFSHLEFFMQWKTGERKKVLQRG